MDAPNLAKAEVISMEIAKKLFQKKVLVIKHNEVLRVKLVRNNSSTDHIMETLALLLSR